MYTGTPFVAPKGIAFSTDGQRVRVLRISSATGWAAVLPSAGGCASGIVVNRNFDLGSGSQRETYQDRNKESQENSSKPQQGETSPASSSNKQSDSKGGESEEPAERSREMGIDEVIPRLRPAGITFVPDFALTSAADRHHPDCL